jgi:hypothetical protein
VRVVVERSAVIGVTVAIAIVAIGSAAAGPLGHLVRVEDTETVVLALILLAGTLLHLLAVGWLQGVMRYMAAAAMVAAMPTLRFLFGVLLLILVGGGVDAALIAAAAPGIVLFAAGYPRYAQPVYGSADYTGTGGLARSYPIYRRRRTGDALSIRILEHRYRSPRSVLGAGAGRDRARYLDLFVVDLCHGAIVDRSLSRNDDRRVAGGVPWLVILGLANS